MKNDVHIRDLGRGRYEISTSDWTATVVKRMHSTDREWNSCTRVYGAVSTFAPELDAKLDENIATPAWGEGDGFTQEAREAHMKEYRKLKRDALAHVKLALTTPISALHAQLGRAGVEQPTVKFSAKAGCSMCHCSPGHVLSTRWTLNGAPVDVWFELTKAAA